MSRTFLLVSGAICWAVVAIVAGIHLATGDALVPVAMATVTAAWVGLRRHRLAEAIAAAA
ncbi:MAG TPA: hypothetical protein VGJ71_03100 [Candidatus Limnocylindrales bacterium]|jgi:hypothetical protein